PGAHATGLAVSVRPLRPALALAHVAPVHLARPRPGPSLLGALAVFLAVLVLVLALTVAVLFLAVLALRAEVHLRRRRRLLQRLHVDRGGVPPRRPPRHADRQAELVALLLRRRRAVALAGELADQPVERAAQVAPVQQRPLDEHLG